MRKLTCVKLIIVLATLFSSQACSPDKDGSLGDPATASFTITPISGRANTYLLTSTSQNAIGFQWDKGTGNYAKGRQVDTAYFPTRGSYTVKLRAFGRGGYTEAENKIDISVDDLMNNPQFKQLTAKSWKLDPAPGANAIIVGTESNPGQYSPGGALAPCQEDDVYIFTSGMRLTYQANGGTFNGSNIAPNFNCGSDRSFSNVVYAFQPGVSAGAGIATITVTGNTPTVFIGVTDPSSNNYRIISISDNAMVLRSGTSTQTVHQFKFVAQ